MVTPDDCLARYGPPDPASSWLTLWDVPADLEVGIIPKKIYCNRDLIAPLTEAFCNIKTRGLVSQLKTWDGCFNIRLMRGSKTRWSLHSWAVAIDINAFENGLGQPPTMSPELVACFTDAGFDWGGTWKRPDGMHFQLSRLPHP